MERDAEGSAGSIATVALLRWFDARRDEAVTTTSVAEAFDVTESTARERLAALSARGELQQVDLEGEYVAWERPVQTYTGRSDDGSYVIQDGTTGLVTRAATRAEALERLAEDLRRYESEPRLGAQVCSLATAEMGPDYLDGLDHLREEYVLPDDRHLLVATGESGVEEIPDESGLRADKQVRGFTLSGVYSASEYESIVFTSLDRILEETRLTRDHFPVSVVKTVVVHPEWKGSGYGRELASTTRSTLGGSRPLLTTIWDRDNEANKRLAEAFTDERLLRFEQEHDADYTCIECGFGESCDCENILYGWRLDAA